MFWLQNITEIAFGAHQGTAKGGEHEHMKCRNAMDLLGLLHYHLRSPKVTAERALRDFIALYYLPSDATMGTLHLHQHTLRQLVEAHQKVDYLNNVAFYKIEELLSYSLHGDSAFVFPAHDSLMRVGTMAEIIRAIKST